MRMNVYLIGFILFINSTSQNIRSEEIILPTNQADENSVFSRSRAFSFYDLRSDSDKKANLKTKKITIIGNVAFPGIYLFSENLSYEHFISKSLWFNGSNVILTIYSKDNSIICVPENIFNNTTKNLQPEDGDVYDVK